MSASKATLSTIKEATIDVVLNGMTSGIVEVYNTSDEIVLTDAKGGVVKLSSLQEDGSQNTVTMCVTANDLYVDYSSPYFIQQESFLNNMVDILKEYVSKSLPKSYKIIAHQIVQLKEQSTGSIILYIEKKGGKKKNAI